MLTRLMTMLKSVFASTAVTARENLESVFGPDRTERVALDWAESVLAEQGLDPAEKKIQAVKALREAEPRLGLAAAKFLADHAQIR